MYDRDTTDIDRSGNGLNALGREQARLAGERLASLGVPIDAFVTSDFTRARETAEEIGRVLGMMAVEDSLIHECTPTPGRPEYTRFHTPEENAQCDAQLRMAWDRYVRPSPDGEAYEILICHGNVIRWFVCRALGLDPTQYYAMDIANASLTVIVVRGDGSTRLAAFSDVGHLPVEKQTWTGRGAGWHPPARK
jgi:serine/threonine-protein phosphatase PGAM5